MIEEPWRRIQSCSSRLEIALEMVPRVMVNWSCCVENARPILFVSAAISSAISVKVRGFGFSSKTRKTRDEPLERECTRNVDGNIAVEVQKVDTVLDRVGLRPRGKCWCDQGKGDAWAQRLHASNPGGDFLQKLGGQARLDFAKDEDTTLPRFEFEADVEPFLGLLADRADADPWKVPDGCLVPERLEDGSLELGSAVLHGFIFSDGKPIVKEMFPI